MGQSRSFIALVFVALLLGVAGCASPPPLTAAVKETPSLAAEYAALQSSQGGRRYGLDLKASSLRIYVFRGGQAARLGHNHVLSAPEFSGFAWLPARGTTGGRFDLAFRLDRLEIDNPQARAEAGAAWSSKPSAADIAGTREHMLESLEADRYPWLRVRSLQLSGELPKMAAQVEIELHGQTRSVWLPLMVTEQANRLTANGALVLRQSDFGIRPYSVFGGLLAVQDELVIEFTLVGNGLSAGG
ncbi:MAG: YceI family protein [Rhodocyclaceae bacterium]|nr:MAG: YceI family protein [Rhodocyclaceae bacterium]